MKYVITEIIIPRTEGNVEVFAPQRIRVSVKDEGGGHYLAVEGINDEPELGETAHEMYFETEEQINDFARICKNMLNPIDPSSGGGA